MAVYIDIDKISIDDECVRYRFTLTDGRSGDLALLGIKHRIYHRPKSLISLEQNFDQTGKNQYLGGFLRVSTQPRPTPDARRSSC